jgi:hypothetical protein
MSQIFSNGTLVLQTNHMITSLLINLEAVCVSFMTKVKGVKTLFPSSPSQPIIHSLSAMSLLEVTYMISPINAFYSYHITA